MADLRSRAETLLSLPGMTKLRAFRILRREFPHAERDQLLIVCPLEGAPTGYLPGWAQRVGKDGRTEANGGVLRPVIVRKPPGGVKK